MEIWETFGEWSFTTVGT